LQPFPDDTLEPNVNEVLLIISSMAFARISLYYYVF